MKYKTRKNIFILFALIFFISVPIIIFYTKGFRLDIENMLITKTGGIDLGISLLNTKVFLNNEYQKETNFIFRNALFKNILPGNYLARIEKENYYDWEKNILVKEGLVEKYSNIRLYPTNLNKQLIENKIKFVAISNNNRYALALRELNAEDFPNILSVILIELNSNNTQTLLTLKKSEDIESFAWSNNSNSFYILKKSDSGKTLFSASINQPKLINWNSFLTKRFPSIYNKNSIIIASNLKTTLFALTKAKDNSYTLHKLDLEEKVVTSNIINNIKAYKIIDDLIFYLDKDGILIKANIQTGNMDELSSTAISKIKDTDSIIIVRDDQKALLSINDNNLFLWRENKPLEKIGENITNASFSNDAKKILFWNSDKIFIYWIKEEFGPPARTMGHTEIITTFRDIHNVNWIKNSSHLAIQTKNNIILIELDSRDKRNIATYDISSDVNIFKVDKRKDVIYSIILDGSFVALGFE